MPQLYCMHLHRRYSVYTGVYERMYNTYIYSIYLYAGILKILLKLFQACSSPNCSQSFSSLMPNPAYIVPSCQDEANRQTTASLVTYMECSWLSARTNLRVSIAAASCLWPRQYATSCLNKAEASLRPAHDLPQLQLRAWALKLHFRPVPSTIASPAAGPGILRRENSTLYFCERVVPGCNNLCRSAATVSASTAFAATMLPSKSERPHGRQLSRRGLQKSRRSVTAEKIQESCLS